MDDSACYYADSGSSLLEWFVLTGTTTTTKYYSVNGQRLAEKVNGALSYLVTDLLNNVVMAINNSGAAIAVELYEPYGPMNYSWGTMPTAHNYTDQRLDSQSGLLYYNFRWYDPVIGRFVRTDTKQNNANGFDPYAYVSDNPETKNDPTGHWGWGALIASVVVVVAVVALVVVAAPVVIAAAAAVGTAVAAGSAVMALGAGVELVGALSTAAMIASAGAGAFSTFQSGMNTTGGTCSFSSDTLVTTKDGKQAIGSLYVGDSVLAYNPKTHEMELQPIEHVWVHADNDLIDVTLTTVATSKGGKTSQQKELLHTTSEHPFLTKEKGFLPAGQLKPGMHVLRADGSYGVVTDWKHVPGTEVMYNLTVQQDHTFVVGVDQWVVHNVCSLTSAQQSILQRLRSQVQVRSGPNAIKPNGSQGPTTKSISELYLEGDTSDPK